MPQGRIHPTHLDEKDDAMGLHLPQLLLLVRSQDVLGRAPLPPAADNTASSSSLVLLRPLPSSASASGPVVEEGPEPPSRTSPGGVLPVGSLLLVLSVHQVRGEGSDMMREEGHFTSW